MSPVQGQLFIPPIFLHTSFHPVPSCLLVFSSPGIPCRWALFADRHPCLLTLAFGRSGLRASLPPGTPHQQVPLILTYISSPFFTFLSSCQTVSTIGLYLYFWVSKNYPANQYQHRTSASNSLLMRLYTIQTSCATVALPCTMHYYRTNTLCYLSDPNSNQLQFSNCSSSIIHCGTR